jgi:soluble lytic murein transglycosylase-like protein
MEQESHFNTHAVSPKGARGLMQLMPGTAARFGVRRPHDAAQNISGGTRYLRELLNRFNNRVDLVLASYNAGEGAVAKFGNRVPPYRETRNYVKKISYRYKRTTARTRKPAAAPAAKDAGER